MIWMRGQVDDVQLVGHVPGKQERDGRPSLGLSGHPQLGPAPGELRLDVQCLLAAVGDGHHAVTVCRFERFDSHPSGMFLLLRPRCKG